MMISTKFNIGDKVCVMQANKKKEKCPVCDGTGELECKGYKFLCPRCEGIGEINSESNVGLCFSDQSYEIKGFSIVERKGELQIRYNLSGYGQADENSCINPEDTNIWHDADDYPKTGYPIVVLDRDLIEYDNHTWEGHAYYTFIHDDSWGADGYRSDVDIIAWRYENVVEDVNAEYDWHDVNEIPKEDVPLILILTNGYEVGWNEDIEWNRQWICHDDIGVILRGNIIAKWRYKDTEELE